MLSPGALSLDMRSPDMRFLDITCPGILSPDILPLDYGIDAEGAGEGAAEDTVVFGHAWLTILDTPRINSIYQYNERVICNFEFPVYYLSPMKPNHNVADFASTDKKILRHLGLRFLRI